MKKENLMRAFKGAFKETIPIFFGYISVGMAFGLLCEKAGYNFKIGRASCRERVSSPV